MAHPIRVVLQEDVESLGSSGDVVRVRPGYARNFLIPRGLAAPATEANLSRVASLKRLAAERAAKLRGEAVELAKLIEATSVKLERAVGDENKMFGSVTAKDVEEAFRAKGIALDRKKIDLKEPIKVLGLTQVPVRLYADVVGTLRVEVVKAG